MICGRRQFHIRAYTADMTPAQERWLNLRTLELFVAVVDSGSLGAAARSVGMAQPNASRAIAELEATLQTHLLDRRPSGSVPTPFGLSLAAHAREVLDAARDFQSWVAENHDDSQKTLSVGASLTIAETLLPVWIAALRERYPDVQVAISVVNSAEVISQVRHGHFHVGFIETPHVPVQLNAHIVQEDELFVVIAPHHHWASRTGRISLQELAETPLVVREPGSGTFEALQDHLAGLDVATPAQVLNSIAAVRVAVASGAGPAVMSELAVRDQLANGNLLRVPLEGDKITRPLTAIWSGHRRPPRLAHELINIAGMHR